MAIRKLKKMMQNAKKASAKKNKANVVLLPTYRNAYHTIYTCHSISRPASENTPCRARGRAKSCHATARCSSPGARD